MIELEKRNNRICLNVTDTDLVGLTTVLQKVQAGQAVSVPLTLSGVAYGVFSRGLKAAIADKSEFFPSHSPAAEGKKLRRKQKSGGRVGRHKMKQPA